MYYTYSFYNQAILMFILDLTWDSCKIFWINDFFIIKKKEVINNLPKILSNLTKQNKLNKILVISWPWSFTTLRVWSLTVNTLKSIGNNIDISQIDKITLLKDLKKNNNNLPDKGIINIWQSHNMLMINLNQKNINIYENIIKKSELNNIISKEKNIFVEKLLEEDLWIKKNIELSLQKLIQQDNNYYLIYNLWNQEYQINIAKLSTIQQELLTPQYMIKAVR